MKLVAKLDNLDPDAALGQFTQGCEVKRTRNGVILGLPDAEGGQGWRTDMLSNFGEDRRLLLEIEEEGGKAEEGKSVPTPWGMARVVCGLSGRALPPYFKPETPPMLGKSAFFTMENRAVSALANGDKGALVLHEITPRQGWASIDHKVLWAGEYATFPRTLAKYKAAMEAARTKAGCPWCQHAHFVALRE